MRRTMRVLETVVYYSQHRAGSLSIRRSQDILRIRADYPVLSIGSPCWMRSGSPGIGTWVWCIVLPVLHCWISKCEGIGVQAFGFCYQTEGQCWNRKSRLGGWRLHSNKISRHWQHDLLQGHYQDTSPREYVAGVSCWCRTCIRFISSRSAANWLMPSS